MNLGMESQACRMRQVHDNATEILDMDFGDLMILSFVGPALGLKALWLLERQHVYSVDWHLRSDVCSMGHRRFENYMRN